MNPLRIAGLAGLTIVLAAFGGRTQGKDEGFDHWKHRKLFPSCETCHAGVLQPGAAVFPAAGSCVSCHDGKLQVAGKVLAKVDWQPATRVKLANNLRFTHERHIKAVSGRRGADSTVTCLQCHGDKGAGWMQVAERPVQTSCMECHGIRVAHYSAPDTACSTCHLTLAEATDLSRQQIAKFPEPESHKAPNFMLARGHGAQAKPSPGGDHHFEVAQSCATCHAREFCSQCHVNAAQVKVIQALASDPRSLAMAAKVEKPASHNGDFISRHGGMSQKRDATCANCHTQQDCTSCHRNTPAVAVALPPGSGEPGQGARTERQRPASHTGDFAEEHGPLASSAPKSCNVCHARAECLDCHRPSAGGADTYHPAGFLTRHPSAAYNRQSDCSECHNQAAFCTTCHTQAGFGSTNGILTGKYHDSKGSFLLGHGQAARQTIESCITCHSEADCMACHSAQTRRFNPHGRDFDAERLRRKNPQTCAACHGRAIPGR